MDKDGERSVRELISEVRARVVRRTFVQDVADPGTGCVDQRKVAAKFNNLEHAVEDLAEAVERIADAEERKSA